ncbi:hypothetical protein PSV08DRAFT_369878 [Bipolaris maydis]|uniref:uncharacterized protein n=1 Tax=Cochliobolus heterostrophus TaxID=5016 RepID=UPI0024D9219B|nr:hypothetical protein J3E73DRAFT_389537 [Bipolaris maydis]KAJ6273117.1 hypothetical protein PSV08DRAFT_369878 [Bipolaris maydis]KAJ6280867.1 hypothetical protein J3E71DRAFT_178063 [Bipolaris maydis]KAJ6284213.1 hypothetical protein J3E71DRAFT_171931 [Bipolaris maydis]
MPFTRKALCNDLTPEAEYCAICSKTLEAGGGKASLVYVLRDCRCVICGSCVQFPSVPPFLPCQHADHKDFGWQRPLRLYNLKCFICLDARSSIRIALVCGHVYCRICIITWISSHGELNNDYVACPCCRNSMTRVWRLLSHDQVVIPSQRGVEIVSPCRSP